MLGIAVRLALMSAAAAAAAAAERAERACFLVVIRTRHAASY